MVHWAILMVEKGANGKSCVKEGTMQKTIGVTRYRVNIPNLSTVLLIVVALFSLSAAKAVDWGRPKPNPRSPVNYVEWVNETLGKGIQHNAFDQYMMAYGLIKPIDDKAAVFGRTGLTGGDGLSAWLRDSKKGLDLFRRASLANEYFFRSQPSNATGEPRVDQSTIVVLLPALTHHRNIVKALLAEGNRASRNGDPHVLVANALTVLRSSHHLYRSPQILGRMTGIASAALAYQSIADASASSSGSDILNAKFAEALSAADPMILPLSPQVQMERIRVWDFCQRVFEPAEKTGSWKIYDPMLIFFPRKFTDAERNKIKGIGFDGTLREVDQYFDAVDEWIDTPFQVTKSANGGKRGLPRFQRIKDESKNPLLGLLLPSLSRLRSFHERITATRRATHLIVQIHVYRKKNGAFPDSLDQLDFSDLAELRLDPYSGRDFAYRSTDKGFQLYSFGANFQDDGGRHTNWKGDGDVVFWPVPKD